METRIYFALLVLGLALLSGCFEKKSHTEKQTGAQIKLQRIFKQFEFSQPVAMLQVPSKNSEWYVVEKQGRIVRVLDKQGKQTKEIYLDITDRVNSRHNEGGLLGMAFHPDYNKNGELFVSYTADGSPLTSVIARFTASAGQAPSAESEQVLLTVEQPYGNHNGGQIAFGPDGYLYIGLGDGGSGGDPQGNGQNTRTLLGAMLRIDVNVKTGSKLAYDIPKNNPFAASGDGRGEIYAWGMRNPWRWSFDRNTGELWVADVGQNDWEEVNLVRQSGNYGWNIREASHCYANSSCEAPDLIDPVSEYSHDEGCSITGGYVYRGQLVQTLQGVYLFADFCSGRIWGLVRNEQNGYQRNLLVDSGLMVSSFAQDNNGEIYVIHYRGEIHQIVPSMVTN